MQYIAITPRNLEDTALRELTAKGFKVVKKHYRKLIIDFNDSPKELLELRAPDDILIYLTDFRDEYHYKGQLGYICDRIREVDLTKPIEIVKSIRELPEKMTFSVTTSVIGERKFTQDYLKQRIADALKKDNLLFKKEGKPDLDFSLIIENDKVFFGLRLAKEPLHKRKYKKYTLPASLKANVAFSMLLIADVKKNETVLDPVCGVGTIPIEATFLGAKAIGFDRDPEAIKLAKKNLKKSGKEVVFEVRDATRTGLKTNSIEKVVANLPFGKQIAMGAHKQFFDKFLKEMNRILEKNGLAVLLTTHPKIIEPLVKNNGFKLIEAREISLFGLTPSILVLKKI